MKKIILILFLGISLAGCGPSDPEGQFEKAMEYFEKVRNNTSWESEYQKLKANANAYKWLNKAIEQGYKPAIEELEKIKAKEEEEKRLAEEEKRLAEEEAKREAKRLARAYDIKMNCQSLVFAADENPVRIRMKIEDKIIVVTGVVTKISKYVVLEGDGWKDCRIDLRKTLFADERMIDNYFGWDDVDRDNYFANLSKGDKVSYKCDATLNDFDFRRAPGPYFYACTPYDF